jgi:RNA polymerase sigma-70 factor (ECF subfamily)
MADSSAVQPDKALEQDEQLELIHQLVDRLPEAQRKVIHLIYDSDLSIQETAQVLQIPEGTVKSRLHYAIKQLTQEWEELASEWENG